MPPFDYDNFEFYACFACIMYLYEQHHRWSDLQEVRARFEMEQPNVPEQRLEDEINHFIPYAGPEFCRRLLDDWGNDRSPQITQSMRARQLFGQQAADYDALTDANSAAFDKWVMQYQDLTRKYLRELTPEE